MHNPTSHDGVYFTRLLCVYRFMRLYKNTYLQTLEDIIEQVMAIASLVSQMV